MSDTQFNPLGTSAAPADWILPSGLQILLKTCFAHFDGSGAGGSFLPTVQIISDSGHTVIEVPQDASVAAGSSVEASWAPFLKGASAAAASTGGLPWAFMSRFSGISITSGTGYSSISIQPGGSNTNVSSDTSIFDFAANLSGDYGIEILTAGLYVLMAEVSFQKGTAPAASSAAGIAWTPSSYYPVMAENVPFASNPTGGGNYFAIPGGPSVVNLDPSGTTPPRTYVLRAAQNSGATLTTVTASALAVQINPTGSPLF